MERTIPVECYNRLSGVLFTNDFFRVSTNKLTFLDLEEKLTEPGVTFDPKSEQGQFRRGTIESLFKEWLAKCNRELDKQILFMQPTEIIERNRKPWTRFMAIEWDGHTFYNGLLVRRRNKTTVNHGRIQSFLLEGEHREELYSSGGMFEIKLEPVAVYQGEIGLHHLQELDRTATEEDIIRSLGLEEGKLPKYLIHRWLDGHNMQPGDDGKWTLQSGKEMGDFQAIIRTSDGIEISRMPSKGKTGKSLAVTAQLIKKTNMEEECIVSIDNPNHIKDYGYVFKKLAVKHFPLGEYILRLAVTMKSQDASAEYSLPRTDIEFTVIEGPATRFDIGDMPSSLQIRKPFSVKLNLTDDKNNPALPPQNMQPNLTCTLGKDRTLEVKSGHFAIEGNSLVSHDVTVMGNMGDSKSARSVKGKLVVAMPQLINQKKPRGQEISVEPGIPNKLRVPMFDKDPCHENGKALKIEVLIEDEDGNLTSGENMEIACKFGGDKDVPTTYHGTAAPNGKVTLTGDRITMHNLKGPKEIKATVYSQDHIVDRVNGKIKIEPRKGPAKFQVFDEDGNEIGNEEVITRTAGKHIDNFGFKLLDEAGRDIKVTQRIASSMYFGGKSHPLLFMAGKLPTIQIEQKVDKQPTHYRLHLKKEEVEFNFNIRSTPGPAASVRVLTEAGHFTLLCGDALNVPVEITDAYGNSVDAKEPPPKEEFFLEAEDGKPLRYEELIQEGQCFIFSGLQYPKIATIPFRGIVRYKGSKTAFTVNIIPGPPTQLMLMNDDEKISTLRGVALKRDVTYRLLDQYGNVICEPKYHVSIKCPTDDVKILGDLPICGKHDSSTGDYIFIGLAVDGPWGVHHILGEMQMMDHHLQSKPIEVEILPNPDIPHQITVDFMKQEQYEAGEDFPSCHVTVFAENGKVMTTLQRENITAEIEAWNDNVELRHVDEEREGKYIFRSMTVPTIKGKYSLTFFVRLPDIIQLSSDKVFFDVVPGPPFQLMPMEDLPGEPQVSNTNDSHKRRIIMANTFCLMDKHNNCVNADIRGTVQVKITASSGQETVPLLEGETVHELLNSRVEIPDVCIKKGCSGVNASKYTLSLTPVLPEDPDHDVNPYECSFSFYNGVEEQERMMRLTQEKSILQEKIKVFEENYQKLEADKKELQEMMQQTRVEGRQLLQSTGPEFMNLQTSAETEQKRREVMEAVERISQLPRRRCRIPVYPKQDTDILGKVAHLAQVEDEREAKVLSWHLSSAMDCVVTMMMQKAEEIIDETNGEQGLLLLNRPADWEKPLPHEHTQFLARRDSIPCNVVYAKHQLKFNVHVEKCKQVFHQLLGDTIIVDSMQDAVKYKEMVLLSSMDCPTILTRDGGRLSEDGTFYGNLNRCPADLSGRVFSQPERSELHIMRRQIDDLKKAGKVFLRLANLQTKLDKKNSELESEDILKERQEIKKAKARVQDIENLLPKGSKKRKRPASPESRVSKSRARRPRSPTTA